MEKVLKIETANKNAIARSISHQMSLTISDVTRMIDLFQLEIENCIRDNKRVQINGFLIFTPKNIEAKKLISPIDGKEYFVCARRDVSVSVGKDFKEYIKDAYTGKVEQEDDSTKKSPRARKRKE